MSLQNTFVKLDWRGRIRHLIWIKRMQLLRARVQRAWNGLRDRVQFAVRCGVFLVALSLAVAEGQYALEIFTVRNFQLTFTWVFTVGVNVIVAVLWFGPLKRRVINERRQHQTVTATAAPAIGPVAENDKPGPGNHSAEAHRSVPQDSTLTKGTTA